MTARVCLSLAVLLLVLLAVLLAVLIAGLLLPSNAATATSASGTTEPFVPLLSRDAAIAVAVLAGVAYMAACAFCGAWLRKPESGTWRIKSWGGQRVSFVVEPEKPQVSEASRGNRQTVRWSVDLSQFDKDDSVSVPSTAATPCGGDLSSGEAGHSAAAAGVTNDASEDATDGDMAEAQAVGFAAHLVAPPDGLRHEDLHAMYDDDTECEYWSAAHSKWIAGVICSHVVVWIDDRPDIAYTCQLHCGQTRQEVPVHALRVAPQPREAVDVWSPSSLTWMPALVQGLRSGVKQTLVGYSVKRVDANGEAVGRTKSGVPAEWVRRRYHVGDWVYVYRGVAQGWEHATVVPHDDAAGDAAQDAPEEGQEELEERDAPHPWRHVRVAGDGGSWEARVPSYLLRPGLVQVVQV